MTPAFCLDYDGTLSPMVADPAAARLPPGITNLLRKLAARHPTAIVSGRSVDKLREWVNVDGLYFAGSHGFEIVGPAGSSLNFTVASQLLPELRDAMVALKEGELGRVAGARLEDNKFSLSVHTRNVSAADLPKVHALVDAALEEQPLLRRHEGIHVIELRPQVLWHKGRAVEWLLKSMCEQLGLPSGPAERNSTALPIYIGDDTTDEDAFGELSDGRGVPIIVRAEPPRRSETAAELCSATPPRSRASSRSSSTTAASSCASRSGAAEGEGEGEGGGARRPRRRRRRRRGEGVADGEVPRRRRRFTPSNQKISVSARLYIHFLPLRRSPRLRPPHPLRAWPPRQVGVGIPALAPDPRRGARPRAPRRAAVSPSSASARPPRRALHPLPRAAAPRPPDFCRPRDLNAGACAIDERCIYFVTATR